MNCPNCDTPMDLMPAEPAQSGDNLPPGGIPGHDAYWSCECGHEERAEEPERFCEFTGPLD